MVRDRPGRPDPVRGRRVRAGPGWSSGTTLYQARKLQDTADRSEGRLTVLRTREDLARYLERRKAQPAITASLLGLEGAHALDGDLAAVDTRFDAGFRMIAPTHFFDTEWAGSAHGLTRRGLTERGRALVRRLEDGAVAAPFDAASLVGLTDALLVAAFSEDEVGQVMGGNATRLLSAALP